MSELIVLLEEKAIALSEIQKGDLVEIFLKPREDINYLAHFFYGCVLEVGSGEISLEVSFKENKRFELTDLYRIKIMARGQDARERFEFMEEAARKLRNEIVILKHAANYLNN